MKLLHLSLICLVMICSAARAQDVSRAITLVEQHVSEWQRRGVEPGHQDDAGYRALVQDLQATGVVSAPYSFGLIGRTYNFSNNAARPCLTVRSSDAANEGYEFFLEHGAAGSKVVSVKRFTIQPGVAYISVPVCGIKGI